jgi:thiol-disulfide isomerase/thioredoxin
MSGFYEVLKRMFQSYSVIFFIILLFLVFAVVAYITYTKYISGFIKNRAASDVANADKRKEMLQIYFFYADWCPHCKKAKPEWKSFRDSVEGTIVNNYKIETISVDCTNLDTDADAARLVKENNISGFPTVIAFKNNQRIDFDAKVEASSLNQFLTSITR